MKESCKEIGPMLQEDLGTKVDVYSIFKPNDLLAEVIEDIMKLGKDLTKQDHIVVGGPGCSQERNCHYSTENDFNFIAVRTSNTGVGFVNLFEGHDMPCVHKKVRSMNIWFYQAQMRHDVSHWCL